MKKLNNLIYGFKRTYPNVNFRYLIKPDEGLIHEFNFVDFKPKRSKKLIEIGKNIAK